MSNTKKNSNSTNISKKNEIAKPVEKEERKEDIGFIEKSEKCKVVYVDNLIYIDFKGFGLLLPNDKGHTEPELEVFYYGDIGDKNFKFRI